MRSPAGDLQRNVSFIATVAMTVSAAFGYSVFDLTEAERSRLAQAVGIALPLQLVLVFGLVYSRLLPADPWAAAKVRELTTFVDLHLELAARELYGKAFFGGDISEANAERVRKLLIKNIAAFKRLAKFSPYVAGDSFTQADCAAFVSLPLVGLASRIVLGEDLLAAAGVDWKAYVKVVGERPSAQRINADRKAEQERLAAK